MYIQKYFLFAYVKLLNFITYICRGCAKEL